MASDYYELLEVGRTASDDEIKRSYRRLARELHPDANPDDKAAEERFKEMTLAYEVLRDPERRRRYDMYGADGDRMAGAGANANDIFGSGLGDIFDAFFGGGGGARRGGPARGNDLEVLMELTFEEAVFGANREVKTRAPVLCEDCTGSGAKPGTYPTSCSTCGGAGEVRRVRQSILGQMVTASPCPACRGAGQQITDPCSACRGEGRRTEERTYMVDVPAGVDDGTQLRLPGRGGAGPRGGPNGDMYVHVRVEPSRRFERHGSDLLHELHIPVTQAALGAHIRFDTLDGTEDLVIPPGTQAGQIFELRGRGVPFTSGRGRGNLHVRVAVDTPSGLTKEQEDLLRQLADVRDEDVAPADIGFLSRIRSAFK